MGENYKDLLNERLKDDGFKKEYEKLIPEYEKIKMDLKTHKKKTRREKDEFGI